MKLRLIIGRAGSGKTQKCLQEIGELLQAAPEGNSLMMILPEHATFQFERELAGNGGIGGFMRAYVFGFRRFAYRILQETGGAVRPHISELGKRLTLGRLLREHKEEFKLFHKAARQRNFAETLSGLIRELKAYDASPACLIEVQEKLKGTTYDKLQDIILIYREFEDFLQGRYTDPEDYLALLAERIPQSGLLKKSQVWIDGFTWFNPQESKVVQKLLLTAECVTVTICLDKQEEEGEQEKETALFYRQWDTRQKLKAWARQMRVEIEEIELDKQCRFEQAPVLAHIERHFYSLLPVAFTGDREGIAIAEAANRRAEVEGMARDILRLCRERGYRWRDIGILLCAVEQYGPIVEQVLEDYDIPFFSDRKRHCMHHPLAELIRSAFEVIGQYWNYEPLFRCLKTDFFEANRKEIDILENYVLEFGIRGFRWLNREPWNFVRRLSLEEDAELSEEQQERLQAVNRIRYQVSRPLIYFGENMADNGEVRTYTLGLYGFLEALNVPGRLEIWADRAEAEGDLEQALEHRQMWDGIVHLLEQMVETCGDQVVSREEFGAMLEDGLENLTLSLIPPGLDYVTVSPLEETSLSNIKAVYIPGVNDGILPAKGREEGILTDGEREQIQALGVALAPGAKAGTFAERFLVYTALTRSRNYLWLGYSLADEEGRGLMPSLVIRHIRELTGAALLSLPAEPAEDGVRDYVAHPQQSVKMLANVLREYKKGQPISELWWDVYNWALQHEERKADVKHAVVGMFHYNQTEPLPAALAKSLYVRHNRLRGSVTRFESFRACPFKHFAQYGLSLKERAVFRLQAPDLGQFFHAVLKRFGEKLRQAGRDWGSVGDDEYRQVVGDIVDELAPKLQNEILLSTEQHKHLTGRLKQRVARAVKRLIDFDRVSKFKPFLLEQSFGRTAEDLPPLVYMLPDDIGLEIAGQIDRLDMANTGGEKYLLVLDYKSGGAWLKVADVYYGLKLQLLTYLLVATKAFPDAIPAGILYYFLKNPSLADNVPLSAEEIEKRINNMLKMPGWVLDEPEVIRLLDSAIDGHSEFLKVALKNDGSLYGTSLPYVKSEEEFGVLLRYVEKTLLATARSIISGETAIQPFRLEDAIPCTLCSYGRVCQFDEMLSENQYRRLSVLQDEIFLKEMFAGEAGES
jgi:ATP-dependent helicase/nuclease subunit B